jgi:hypothetical protein
MTVARSDQYQISLFVDGTACGVFDDADGGGVDSSELKYRPGGMGDQVSLGGPQMVDNITLTRGFDRARDQALLAWMISRCGKGSATVVKQPLDVDKNAFGDPIVYTGKLKKYNPAKVQADANTVDTYDFEISTNSTVAA